MLTHRSLQVLPTGARSEGVAQGGAGRPSKDRYICVPDCGLVRGVAQCFPQVYAGA
jgi:hypothetical protein